MLVYGDPQFSERLGSFIARLAQRLSDTRADDLDGLRTLLIHAGQLEQGIADVFQPPHHAGLLPAAIQLSDHLAHTFFVEWARTAGVSVGRSCSDGRSLLLRAAAMLPRLTCNNNPLLTIKIPEGFEFYALFPEQYCAASLEWAHRHEGAASKRALVVGVRSIGTTLSALVKAAIESHGWAAVRTTVRPTGHPFARQVDLARACPSPPLPCPFHHAIIVDEGPGISGSSLRATAQAVAEHGVAQISVLPGHNGAPTSPPNPEVRRWWNETPRFFTNVEDLRWKGKSLHEALVAQASPPAGSPGVSPEESVPRTRHAQQLTQLVDLSAGLWRNTVFESEDLWPPVAIKLERLKFLYRNGSGAGSGTVSQSCNQVLWKFNGFGCATAGGTSAEQDWNRMKALSKPGFVPEPLASFRGFMAMPWIEGQRVRLSTLNSQLRTRFLEHVAKYIIAAAVPPHSSQVNEEGRRRLADMLVWNTKEALGDEQAHRSQKLIKEAPEDPLPCFGDGHMAPWEWVRTPAGRLVKTDCTGHAVDHTLVGSQSILWDVAGTIVEWDLDSTQTGTLVSFLQCGGIKTDPALLQMYVPAYAAFRLGTCKLFADLQPRESGERTRLEEGTNFYKKCLSQSLSLLPL